VTTEQLYAFVREHIPGFAEPRIEVAGSGFHYTRHAQAILSARAFLGAPVTPNLISTQRSAFSAPATDSEGVVFAYPSLPKTAEMGLGQEIFRIHFSSALSVVHAAEREIESRYGLIDSRSLLIFANEIVRFERLGNAENYRNIAR